MPSPETPMVPDNDLSDLVLDTLDYHDFYSTRGPARAATFWGLVMRDFIEERGYSPSEFTQLSWEADKVLEQRDADCARFLYA